MEDTEKEAGIFSYLAAVACVLGIILGTVRLGTRDGNQLQTNRKVVPNESTYTEFSGEIYESKPAPVIQTEESSSDPNWNYDWHHHCHHSSLPFVSIGIGSNKKYYPRRSSRR